MEVETAPLTNYTCSACESSHTLSLTAALAMHSYLYVASYPGPFNKSEKSPLLAHALNIPGILDNTVIPPCAVTFTCTLPYIYPYTAARPGLCCVVYIMPCCDLEAKRQC